MNGAGEQVDMERTASECKAKILEKMSSSFLKRTLRYRITQHQENIKTGELFFALREIITEL